MKLNKDSEVQKYLDANKPPQGQINSKDFEFYKELYKILSESSDAKISRNLVVKNMKKLRFKLEWVDYAVLIICLIIILGIAVLLNFIIG